MRSHRSVGMSLSVHSCNTYFNCDVLETQALVWEPCLGTERAGLRTSQERRAHCYRLVQYNTYYCMRLAYTEFVPECSTPTVPTLERTFQPKPDIVRLCYYGE